MDANFWHERWANNEIGFHQSEANPLLVENFNALSLPVGSRIFLPLCGKTLDIGWLLGQGYRIAGAELSELAVGQLFSELSITPKITERGPIKHYRADTIDIFAGDIFELPDNLLGPVDAVYDRAALVALPETLRQQYTTHLTAITQQAPQLLICFEYDQSQLSGPPFSISAEEVRRHYAAIYQLSLVKSVELAGEFKGLHGVKEHVWLLQNSKA